MSDDRYRARRTSSVRDLPWLIVAVAVSGLVFLTLGLAAVVLASIVRRS